MDEDRRERIGEAISLDEEHYPGTPPGGRDISDADPQRDGLGATGMTNADLQETAADADPDDLGSSNPYESGLTAGGTGTGIPGMTGQDDGVG